MNQETRYTVFNNDNGFIRFLGDLEASSPQEAMEVAARWYRENGEWASSPNLVAWTTETPSEENCDALCAASISAGRTISLVGDKFVPNGVEEQTAFRIGGIYRDGVGDLYQLLQSSPREIQDDAHYFPGIPFLTAWGINAKTGQRDPHPCGRHRVSDGWFYCDLGAPDSRLHLIPGELHQVDGSWVPVGEKKEAAEPRFPGDQDFSGTTAAERTRAPLAYFTESKRFDPFADFAVSRFDASEGMDAAPAQDHPLTLCADLEPRGYRR